MSVYLSVVVVLDFSTFVNLARPLIMMAFKKKKFMFNVVDKKRNSFFYYH